MQKAIEKYRAWTQKPFTKGYMRLGPDHGRLIRNVNGKPRATDGPFIESKEVLGGYYTIEAENYDEAVKLALTHPHVEYGLPLEIRQSWEA
jgi:hypothetical protein